MMEQLLEYFGVLTGLLYLFLEIRQHRAMWVVGFLTSLVYVFVFFFSKIYADMGLNIYYVAISIYGFWQWTRSKGRQEQTAEDIETAPQEVILYRNMTLRLFAGISFSIVALFAWGATIWLMLIGLFFGMRYRIDSDGDVPGSINNLMNHAANAADDIKQNLNDDK